MNITNELGLKLPIFQAPLECFPGTSSLVAKVSECGALGIYCTGSKYLNEINDALTDIKLRTEKSFAVTIDITNYDGTISLAEKSSANLYLQEAYKALKLAQTEADTLPKFKDIFDCVTSHKPAAITFQNGLPDNRVIQEAKRNGIITMAIASNVLESIAIDNSNVDIIILQGMESAGSLSQFCNELSLPYYPINTLLHHTITNVTKPLVVWGDYQVPTNIVGALVNGACAAVIDTPFWTTHESPIPNSYRQRLAEHTEMTITTSTIWRGYSANVLQNNLTKVLLNTSLKTLPAKKQQRLMLPIIRAAIVQDQDAFMPLWAGYCAKPSNKTVSELCERFCIELGNMIE